MWRPTTVVIHLPIRLCARLKRRSRWRGPSVQIVHVSWNSWSTRAPLPNRLAPVRTTRENGIRSLSGVSPSKSDFFLSKHSVNGNSVFTSRSHRIGLLPNDKQSFPAPADYSVDNYRINRNIRVRRGRKMNRAFCSSIPREESNRLANKKEPYSPGPAAYTVKEDVAEPVEMMPITLGCR